MSKNQEAFVAYTTNDKAVGATVLSGVRKSNSIDASPVRYQPWEFNDISGAPLTSPIISGIDNSNFIVADITFLNLNVVYEIGFAIGRRKKVLLIKCHTVDGDNLLAKEVGIFDTLGYSNYTQEVDLVTKLTSHIETDPLPFTTELDTRSPVYLMAGHGKSDASTTMVARVKKARYKYRSFSPTEDVRLSAIDAIHQVARAAGVILLLDGASEAQDIRTMFVAGLADGMEKPTLILSPVGYNIPLDVRDSAKLFRRPEDISEFIADFCPEINSKLQENNSIHVTSANLLNRISMGDPTAENEMTTLADYYLPTNEYLRAERGEVNLVVGRKGSGKTALFIKLRDAIRHDKRNIVVDLKPESYQLLKLKDEILRHLAEGSRQHLITAFWEYLILLEVAYKLLEKDRTLARFNHKIQPLYEKLEGVYFSNGVTSEGDFSERLLKLSERLTVNYAKRHPEGVGDRISAEEITEILYTHDLRSLRECVGEYLESKEKVLVLFDNLDKSWSTIGVDEIDAVTLRCLIDAGRKVERDMQRRGRAFRCMVFVRNDVYQHLMEKSPDYGKEMRATLDWNDPDLLREMLRLRLVSGLNSEYAGLSFQDIWSKVAVSHVLGEESSSFIIDRSLMRPRNVLKLFNYARAFAANFGRERIEVDDFYKGLLVYSQDLVIELDRELSDVYPQAKDLLYYFIDCPNRLTVFDLIRIFHEAGIAKSGIEKIRNYLLYHGVLGLSLDGNDQYIFDVGYDIKPILIRVARQGENAVFVLNPAFSPALDSRDVIGNS